MSWNDGYNNENDYTFTYCGDMNPLRIHYSCLINGFMAPNISRACELGFGQGLSINFHAIDAMAAWVGNDFLPTHVTFASNMKKAAGTDVNLSDKSFREMSESTFPEKFDYICLHGIWSWISEINRSYIRSFISQNLKENGIVYISYNTKPGWASMLPIRDFLSHYIQTNLPAAGSMDAKTKEAIKFSSKLSKTKPLYLAANPHADKRIDNLRNGEISYIAHEYFNKDWETFYFSEVNTSLDECKLRYVGSTDFMAGMDDINITAEQKKLIGELHGSEISQDLRDICLNQSFRKDIWVKGGTRLSTQEKINELRKVFVVLRNPKDEYDFKIKGNLGEGELQKDVYGPIIETIRIKKVDTIGKIVETVSDTIKIDKALEAIHVLISKGDLLLVHEPSRWDELSISGQKINEFIYEKVINGNTCSFLYSAATGGGLQVNLLQQLFVGAFNKNPSLTGTELAGETLAILKSLGRNILDEGVKIENYDDELRVLTDKANNFINEELEYFKFLRIVV